jgi:RNA polymerase sigma-70 factor (ECF subfamily)
MKVRAGDGGQSDRFEPMYRRYRPSIVRYFMRAFHVPQVDAEDLAQDTFLRFFDMLDEYRGQAEWALLEKIARTVGLNRVRSLTTIKRGAGVRPLELDDQDLEHLRPAAPTEPDYAEREEQAKRSRHLHEEIAGLPHGQRQCLLLWLQEFSFKEIATTLRISIDAVKSRLRDARRLLRERMGEEISLPEDET